MFGHQKFIPLYELSWTGPPEYHRILRWAKVLTKECTLDISGSQRSNRIQTHLELTLEPITKYLIKSCMCKDYFKVDLQKVLKRTCTCPVWIEQPKSRRVGTTNKSKGRYSCVQYTIQHTTREKLAHN